MAPGEFANGVEGRPVGGVSPCTPAEWARWDALERERQRDLNLRLQRLRHRREILVREAIMLLSAVLAIAAYDLLTTLAGAR